MDQGVLNINGSLVENIRGAVGEVIGGIQYGFARVINFDSRFATAPPPFNPTTGALQIIAWKIWANTKSSELYDGRPRAGRFFYC